VPKITAATVAEHKVRTRDLLLDAVESLVIERPFASVSMRDIAERASVSRTVIYNYASDPISLLVEATHRGSAEVRAAVAEQADQVTVSPSIRLRAIVTVLLRDYARSTHTMLTVLGMERHSTNEQLTEALVYFRTRIGRSIMDVVRDGVEAGEFAPVADPQLTLAFMVGVMQSAVHKIMDLPDDRRDSVADAAADFLLNALSGTSTRSRE
jgi:AcrR family transcriptional regulator